MKAQRTVTALDRPVAHLLILVTLSVLLFCGLLALSGPIADALAWLDEPTPAADMTVAAVAFAVLVVLCVWSAREDR